MPSHRNFVFEPIYPEKITFLEVEELLLCLLKDVCDKSSNLNLKNTKVNYAAQFNLGDLQPTGTLGLLTFFHEDTGNGVSLAARYLDVGTNLSLLVSLGLITRLDVLSYAEHLEMLQEIVDAVCYNRNNQELYCIQKGNYWIGTNLSKNQPEDFPKSMVDINKQVNYLTSIINITFNFTKFR